MTLYIGGPAGELAATKAALAEAEQEREMADQGREAVELAMRNALARSIEMEVRLEEALRKAEGEPDRVRTAAEEAVASALKAQQDELLGLRHRLSQAEQGEAEAAEALAAMTKDVGELENVSARLERLTRENRAREALLLSIYQTNLRIAHQQAEKAEALVVSLRQEVRDGLSLLRDAKAESELHHARATDLERRLSESESHRDSAKIALLEASEAHGREVSAMAEAALAEEAQIWAKARKASILWAALLWLLTMLVAWLSSAWLIVPLASWPWAA